MFGLVSAVSFLPKYLYNAITQFNITFGVKEWSITMGSKVANHTKLQYLNDKFDIVLPFLDFAKYRETAIYASMMAEIQTFYFGKDATVEWETINELVQALSDIAFGYGIAKSADAHATLSNGKTYYYRYLKLYKLVYLK